ncbi:hypothetical protein SIM22_05035 [Bacillus cereus group sp. BfR-BA-01363]|uniref:hypothetical protein n=1 Tax=Bacillus cereus group sp. BfR-BA-01363 TaxID=3094882 RepID=UPI0029C402A4|nr:hypothetical protein [Bacillus cereus group sp. BfR-BA-01363]MDX5853496.1 hypothetical protein [Bacillus cereus group sp. BfR-BA-01363]
MYVSDYFQRNMIEIVKSEEIYEYRIKGNVPFATYPMIMHVIESWLLDYRFKDRKEAEKELRPFIMCLKQYSLNTNEIKRYCMNNGIPWAEDEVENKNTLLEIGIEYIKEIDLWILPNRVSKKGVYLLCS